MARSGLKAGPPGGPFPKLGYLVREIAGGLTTRQIAERAPISQPLAWMLTDGQSVGEDTLYHFAKAFDVALNPLRYAMGVPVYPIDPITKEPWPTVEFFITLLDSEVAAEFERQAKALGITEGDPEPLKQLLNRLLKQGLAAEQGNSSSNP